MLGRGMVIRVATSKITVTLPDEQLDEIRALIAAGEAMLRERNHPGQRGLIALDRNDRRVLALLARTATADIVDAHVVVCARRARQAVVTSEADDLRRIAPELMLVEV